MKPTVSRVPLNQTARIVIINASQCLLVMRDSGTRPAKYCEQRAATVGELWQVALDSSDRAKRFVQVSTSDLWSHAALLALYFSIKETIRRYVAKVVFAPALIRGTSLWLFETASPK
jgi:hypothetical protein